MEANRLNSDEIKRQLDETANWTHQITKIPGSSQNKSIDMLFKMFQFSDYQGVRDFVNKVTDISEELNHYPTVTFAKNYSSVVVWTAEAEGLTENDFALAKQINEIRV